MYISNLNASLSYYLGIIHVGEEVLVTHRGKTLFSRTTLFDRRKFRETASAVEHRAVGQGGLDSADAVRGDAGAVEAHGFELGEFLQLLQLRVADLGVGEVEPGQIGQPLQVDQPGSGHPGVLDAQELEVLKRLEMHQPGVGDL